MSTAFDHAAAAAAALSQRASAPIAAVVLGSGLGDFAEQLTDPQVIPYEEIPHFPSVKVTGHAGQLVIGGLPNGARVAALAGRVHLYEGHPIEHVVHPVRALKLWGVKAILLTNAAGGISAEFMPGDLMRITDHLNLTGINPLSGPNDERLGVRFPDMTYAYDPELAEIINAAAEARGVALQKGVYAGLLGPSYETPAEIKMLYRLGADAVGMSTVGEVIAAHHAGLRVAGISCITNVAAGLSAAKLDHAEVKETAAKSRAAFISLVEETLARITEALHD
ncbi:purine-nucleoside phosphorylase [Myxococcota bacterium]|nr:purine-nucleoside phosphorylase [Myxococcota bacterium]MBU1430605.1 purine-nucleoside phosphorylase [Myxococcota bacterium]MBU1898710.1 purine-nucleoside phosphorylase [Myxococcota bacterium]